MRPALGRWLVERGGLVALVAFAVYLWIAPTVIVDGDNAEFASLGTAGGVAHPTGYPAYLLWLRATSWLPGATPAHTTAIATAILAAVQLVVLHAACRAWGARATAASFAVAIYASGPVVMRYSTEAEVFALNQLVVATVLLLSARSGPLRGTWRVAALGLVAGVGIADHVTCVLAAPVGLLGAVRGVREAHRPVRAALAGIAALALGLTPYIYLLITPENAGSWETLDGLGAVVNHILRDAYGGPGAFSPHGGELHIAANLAALAMTLGRAWWWLPGLAGVAMLGYRATRTANRGEPRVGWWMLAAAIGLSGPVLAMRFDVHPSALDLYVVRRFHLMPVLLLAVPVAAVLDAVVARIEAGLRPVVGALACVLAFVTAALFAIPDVARTRTPALEHAMRGLLRGLPPNAVVLLSGDIWIYGTSYLQVACGERPDVIIAVWRFVKVEFYRERLARRGIVIDTTPGELPSVRLAGQIMASGRPLLVDVTLGNVLNTLPSYPYGTLFRVLPRGEPAPSIDEVAAVNRDWFAALDLDYPRPGPDDEYPTIIHRGYAETWRIIAQIFARKGHRDDAENAAALMRELGPTP